MNKISAMIGVMCLSAVGAVYAADSTAATATTANPMDQAVVSVNKNLQANPDSKGLNTGADRLQINQERYETNTQERLEKMNTKVARTEKITRPEKIERPAKIEHPGH